MADADTSNAEQHYRPTPANDPLLGTQEHPDQPQEQDATPEKEAAQWPTAGAPEKSRWVAGTLGVLLGFLGAHRFYLNFPKVGAFQLLLFLCSFGLVLLLGVTMGQRPSAALLNAISAGALVWIWGLVEGIMIFTGQLRHDGHAHPLAP